MARLSEHPRFWQVVALSVGLILGSVLFNFFTGFYPVELVTGTRQVSQTIVNLESSSLLNQPPILLVPSGTVPLNATYNVAVQGQYTVYMWVIQFANSTIHPLPILEPAYIYWQAVNVVPLSFKLYAVYVRFHYFSRLIYGGWTLNGTRVFIQYSPTFYIPTVKAGLISNLLRPSNATTILNYPTILDPNLPYSNLTQATPRYTPDPWVVLSSPETILNGFYIGGIVGGSGGLGSYGIILVTIHPHAPKHRVRIRKRLVPLIVERFEELEE